MYGLSCFKTYDIRGKLGVELNEGIAYRIGRAMGEYLQAKKIVVGGDARATSESLKLALSNGLQDAGVNVLDIGLVGTEEIYFATSYLKVDGGIEVTASHNPIDYNGMKLVAAESKPIFGETGLNDIKSLSEKNQWQRLDKKGVKNTVSILEPYTDHLLSYINAENIKPLRLVVNSGNGVAGHVIDALESKFQQANIPISFIKVHHQPDASFPNGIPNPLLVENRKDTADAVRLHQADMGIAWDGDFDRCFLFDEKGNFIEGYYIVGLLAEAFLQKQPNSKIIHDPRLFWNTEEVITNNAGQAIMSKSGHAFIKDRMRSEDAIYGGEMSAHHYFRDFAYCDSGMIPWLLIAELLSIKKQTISSMVSDAIKAYPSSGEINLRLTDAKKSIQRVLNTYKDKALHIDDTDGIGLTFSEESGQWRFNLRMSNTEPLVRLNVESKGNVSLMKQKTADILALLKNESLKE